MANEMHNFLTNQVAAAMPQLPAESVLNSVSELGPELEIEIAAGEEGIAHIDASGSEHGFLSKMRRTLQEEQLPITMLSDAMEAGESVVFVHNVDDDNLDAVVAALNEAGASVQFYFGDYSWRRFDRS